MILGGNGAFESSPYLPATNLPYSVVDSYSGRIYMSAGTGVITIEEMDQQQALEAVREISSRAQENGNWDLILGSNGKSGRNATGNYSLLAKAIGMTRVHVSRVLQGKVQPSHGTLRKLSEVTGISLDEISRFIVEHTEKRAA